MALNTKEIINLQNVLVDYHHFLFESDEVPSGDTSINTLNQMRKIRKQFKDEGIYIGYKILFSAAKVKKKKKVKKA